MPSKFLVTNDLLLNDKFRKLSNGAKVLFLYCCSIADSEGFFINKGVAIDMSHTTEHDFDELLENHLVITNVYCDDQYAIKLWFLLNSLRFSQMAKSKLTSIRTTIFIKENGAYTFDDKMNSVWYPLFFEVAKRIKLNVGGGQDVITNVFQVINNNLDLANLNNRIITNDDYLRGKCYDSSLILGDVYNSLSIISK